MSPPAQVAKEHAQHADPVYPAPRPAWVDGAPDEASSAPGPDAAFRTQVLFRSAAAAAGVVSGRHSSAPRLRPDVDAVSLRHMPNSTGRALLAEGRGSRARITRLVPSQGKGCQGQGKGKG